MKIRLLFVCLLFLLFKKSYSQDRIILVDSTVITCEVLRVNPYNVEYKKWENRQGPVIKVAIRNIMKIVYMNGYIENYNRPKYALKFSNYFRMGFALSPVNKVQMRSDASEVRSIGINTSFGGFLDEKEEFSLLVSLFAVQSQSTEISSVYISYVDYKSYGFNVVLDYYWYKWKRGALYTGAGIGIVKEYYKIYYNLGFIELNEPETRLGLSYQMTAIGVVFNPLKHIGVFSAIGVGHQYILNTGIQLSW